MLALVLVAGWLVWRDDTYEVAPERQGTAPGHAAAAATLVHEWLEAVESGDPDAARALGVDERSADQLEAIVENARSLRVSDLGARYVDQLGVPGPDGTWSAAVDLTWAFDGFDDAPARSEVVFRFADGGDGSPSAPQPGIAGVGGEGRRVPVWLRGPVSVDRSARVLVVAERGDRSAPAAAAQAREVAQRARRGVAAVSRALASWRGRLVVEVPATAAALDVALDAEPGTYRQIAAVTTSVDGGVSTTAPVHVFLNPEVSDRLRRRGSQVVMTHEVVHVATSAATTSMPLWLLEGFADHVALRDVALPARVAAGRVIAQVRRSGVPARLPGAAEFDPQAEDLQAAYESAWIACVVVAERLGEEGLLRLYTAVADGQPIAAALADQGWSEQELLGAWQARLRDLAG